jgi:hypothetical protein
MNEYINTPFTYVYGHKFKLTTKTQETQVGNLKQYRTMKRSEYDNEKNESEGRSAKKRALRRFGEFKLAKRRKEGGKLGI